MNNIDYKNAINRKLQWLEQNFGGTPPVQPKISRESYIKFIKENIRYLRFASNQELFEISELLKTIRNPIGEDHEDI